MRRVIVILTVCVILTLAFISCDNGIPKKNDGVTTADTVIDTYVTNVEISTQETEPPTTAEPESEPQQTTEALTTQEVTTEEITTEAVTTEAVTTQEVTTQAPSGGGAPSYGGGGVVVPSTPADPCAYGHDEEQHEGKAASCTEIGWAAYVTCKREGCKYTTRGADIPALRHSIDENGECERCDAHESRDLEFTSNGDNTCYVSGAAKCNDSEVIIPSVSPAGDTVIAIGEEALINFNRAHSIIIPDTVKSIGDGAFKNCVRLMSVEISDSVTSIGNSLFSGCVILENITVMSGNTKYHSSGNCIIETETQTLVAGCSGSVIPSDGSVTSIGDYAFYDCDSLTGIDIPNGITSIGNNAFEDCFMLENIDIPTGVKTIGDNAFKNCIDLKNIEIPNGVTSIGDFAFYNTCEAVDINIEIPASVTSIGVGAFGYCPNIESITVASGNTKYHSSGNCLIETETRTLIAGCPNSVIPSDGSVTSIADYAFSGSYSSITGNALTSIEIPVSVTKIGYKAFDSCQRLKTVYYVGNSAQWKAIDKATDWDKGAGYYDGYTVVYNYGVIVNGESNDTNDKKLPETNWNGAEFRILGKADTTAYSSNFEVDYDELPADIVGKAVYERNESLKNKYGMDVVGTLVSSPATTAKTMFESGDDLYDMVVLPAGYNYVFAEQGYFLDIASLDHVNLDHGGWTHNNDKQLSMGGRLYYTSNKFLLEDKNALSVLFYNRDMAQELNLGYLEDAVFNGTWTVDKLIEFSRVASAELDDVQGMSKADRWGVVTPEYDALCSFVYGIGFRFTKKDASGYPVSVNVTDAYGTTTIYDMGLFNIVEELIGDENVYYCDEYLGTVDWNDCADQIFSVGRALVISRALYASEIFSENVDFDMGILPNAKQDTLQKEYRTLPTVVTGSLLSIPATVADTSFVGFALEALTEESVDSSYDAYVEKLSTQKEEYDEDKAKCLDIIFNGVVYDIAYVKNIGGMGGVIRDTVSKKRNDLSYTYGNNMHNVKIVEKELADIKEIYANLEN